MPHSAAAAAVAAAGGGEGLVLGEGVGKGSGIPMPQLLHTGRRRGHLNEVLTDIQARSEAGTKKTSKKATKAQARR